MLSQIRVVDARMGRGKTSAAAGYMSHFKGKKHFLYITPYLTEVDRICEACDFEQPDSDHSTKLAELKGMMHRRKNIAATHSLFYLMDEEALSIAKQKGYCLIIDESIETIRRVNITDKDTALLLDKLTTVDEDGFVHWIDAEYDGKFSQYKEMADSGSLCKLDAALLCIMKPEMIEAFDEVIMMTYLFGGQYQKAYLDYFGFEYQICGIDDSDGYNFTDAPDMPPPLDYKSLINIVDDPKLNDIGNHEYALSVNWYKRRKREHPEMKTLRNNMNTFFRRRTSSKSNEQLWTCYKGDSPKLYGPQGRFASSFLQVAARATNEYRNRNCLAYMVNRFIDPNVGKFFATKGIYVNEDEFALAEMLQWIWRSCIRDDQPIELYIPSRRMRELLQGWIESTSKGDTNNE